MKDETKAKEFASKAEERRVAAGIKNKHANCAACARGVLTAHDVELVIVPNRRRKFTLVAELEFESFSAMKPDELEYRTAAFARVKSAMQSIVFQVAASPTFSDVTQNFHLKVEDVE